MRLIKKGRPSFAPLIFLLGCETRGAQRPNKELLEAVKARQTENVKSLLDRGADPNARIGDQEDYRIPLVAAAANGYSEIVRLLVAAGADLENRDGEGSTPLIAAVNLRQVDTVQILLELGADPNGSVTSGATALFFAHEPEIWKPLLRAGADVNAATNTGVTSLMRDSAFGNLAKVQALIQAGADVNRATENGDTALMAAAGHYQPEVVLTLLRAGADVNAANRDSETALMAPLGGKATMLWEHEIDRKKTPEVLRILIAAGADVNARSKKGTTALGLAKTKRRGIFPVDDIVKVLKEAGAKE